MSGDLTVSSTRSTRSTSTTETSRSEPTRTSSTTSSNTTTGGNTAQPRTNTDPGDGFNRVNVDRKDLTQPADSVTTDPAAREQLRLALADTPFQLDAARTGASDKKKPPSGTPSGPSNSPGDAGGSGLDDPAPMNAHAGSAAAPTENAQLFVDGITSDDAVQGQAADCYVLAGMSAVADSNPQAIDDAITQNDNGTYTVRFYNDSGQAEFVTVDGDLYRDKNGNPIYGNSPDRGEVWPQIMEKAYAQWKGGYEAIGNGGDPGEVMRAITGRPTTWNSNDGANADDVWSRVTSGQPTTANTVPPEQANGRYDGTGLVPWHIYPVVDTQEENGERYVVMRNPWGNTEFTSDQYSTDVDRNGDGQPDGNDGYFRISLDDYMRLFGGTAVNG